jgi:peptidoglycan/xylan/chitin deacetylase (PgdA/CDA1 family)
MNAPMRAARWTLIALAALTVAGCSSTTNAGSPDAGGTSSTSAASEGGASSTSNGSTSSSSSSQASSQSQGLPVPPGAGNVPAPTGAVGGLSVLSWAGFKGAVSFTFDDSQPSQIDHYAELEMAGVPMTFYISSGNSGEANYDATWTQAVKDGHEIGNHTVHHCMADLTGCSFGTPLATLADELDQCSSYITGHTGQSDVWTGASPFGDTGYDSAAQTRFLAYRGVGNGTIAPNDGTNAFNLPCLVAAAGQTAAQFDQAIDGAHGAGTWLIILIHSILPTTATWYNPVNITDVTGSMAHAVGLGDEWVDTVANIAAYWRAQKLVAGLTPATSGGAMTWTWTLPAHFPPHKVLRVTVTGGTPSQDGTNVPWMPNGYYEISLDSGNLTLSP